VSSPPDFHIEHQNDGGRLRLSVSGEVDLESTPRLEAAVAEACGVARTVELDLHEVSFIDSTGIRAVLGAKTLCAERGVEFLMVPSRHHAPHRTFELAGVLDLLPWRSRHAE
jgi:anti-sigma B factor antagonist